MGKKSKLKFQKTNNKGPGGKELSIIIPIDGINSVEYIDALIYTNILTQINVDFKNDIVLIFMTHLNDQSLLDHLNRYKEAFKDVKIFITEDKTLARLDTCVFNYVTTRFFCIKTLAPQVINGRLLASNIEWLPNHLYESISRLLSERTKYTLTTIETVDIDTYGIKELPDLLDTRQVDEKLNVGAILLDEFILSKDLGVKFIFSTMKHPQTGMMNFVPGVAIGNLLQNKVPGSIIETCTVRQYLKANAIKKQLRVIIDGQTIKAI